MLLPKLKIFAIKSFFERNQKKEIVFTSVQFTRAYYQIR